MPKVLMYSDLHIGAGRVDLNKVIETLKWVNKIAKQKEIEYIFNLGDTFDFYNHTKSKMKITPEFMTMMREIGFLFEGHYILRGNHEYHEEGDLISVFELFGAIPVCEPRVIRINTLVKNILLMPYYDELALNKLKLPKQEDSLDTYDYVFGHYDISGASFESGFKETGKDSSIVSKVLFDKMYIGHYHIKQQVRSNIWSVGSCQSRVKTDNETKMGITILDVETGETEFIENPHAEYNASDSIKVIGSQHNASKKYNLLDEIENFKLEKTGLDVIIDYTKTKKGTYDEIIVDYTIDYLEGLKK